MTTIKLQKKPISNGRYSYYIEYYKGSYLNSEGKRKYNRESVYLNLYLLPETSEENIAANKKTAIKANNLFKKAKASKKDEPITIRELQIQNKQLQFKLSEEGYVKENIVLKKQILQLEKKIKEYEQMKSNIKDILKSI